MSNARRPLIAGNWKMNTSRAEAVALAAQIAAAPATMAEILVCPPYPWLIPVADVMGASPVKLGAQDCAPYSNGAYTGAVSATMLRELVSYVIVGHSERRQVFAEGDELIRDKLSAVIAAQMTAILCVGESLDTRRQGTAAQFVTRQLEAALSGRSSEELDACVIAYEPIWAIGTGVAASAADAEEMCAVIRAAVETLVPGSGPTMRVLYGGSVNPANAAETLAQPNVDGALVGGASLKAETFLAIVESVHD